MLTGICEVEARGAICQQTSCISKEFYDQRAILEATAVHRMRVVDTTC